ncbi:LysR substrate-binding domain-containing protein [Streptomyces sp. NPDC004227]
MLRLALKADIDGGLLPQILDTYAQEEASLPVELVLGRVGKQAQAVRDGRSDTALLLSPSDDRGLDSEPLLTEPFLIAMAAGAPLAARTCLRLTDLAGWRLPDGSPADQGPVTGRHGDGGTHTRRPGPTKDEAFTADTAQDASDLPVQDVERATLSVAWPQHSRSAAVAACVRAATKVAATAQPEPGTPQTAST